MLLENAARLNLKNRIIIDALTAAAPIPSDEARSGWVPALQDVLETFAGQADESAERLAVERAVAARAGGKGRYYHDYRQLDTDNLSRRIDVAAEVARRLRAISVDLDALGRLLSDSRALADDELLSAARTTLSRVPDATPEDSALIEERLQSLATIDLPALAASTARSRQEIRAAHQPEVAPAPARIIAAARGLVRALRDANRPE